MKKEVNIRVSDDCKKQNIQAEISTIVQCSFYFSFLKEHNLFGLD